MAIRLWIRQFVWANIPVLLRR